VVREQKGDQPTSNASTHKRQPAGGSLRLTATLFQVTEYWRQRPPGMTGSHNTLTPGREPWRGNRFGKTTLFRLALVAVK